MPRIRPGPRRAIRYLGRFVRARAAAVEEAGRLNRLAGRVVFITPQEVGYRSDTTHVRFVDLAVLRRHADSLGLTVDRAYSFPFPRLAGRVFRHNEFVLVARHS